MDDYLFPVQSIKIPNQINSENIKKINSSNNLIESIPYVNCYEMKFSFNRLIMVKDVSNRITSLDVSKNNLNEIPDRVFSILIIKTLLAPFNNIQSLPIGISESLLRTIDLSFNPIENLTSLPKNIEHLALNYCNLSSIPLFFEYCKELAELSLIGNRIESIENSIPRQIQILNLSNNRIRRFSLSDRVLKDLKFLDLSLNRIEDCQNLVFQTKLPNLGFLNLADNPIEQSSFNLNGKAPFSLIPKLRRLVLSNIKLYVELNLSHLRSLCYLDLSNSLLHSKSGIEKKKLKCISIHNYKESVSYSNKLGRIEAHENYMLISNKEKTAFYGIFSNFEFMSQKVEPVLNGRQTIGDLSFVKNFVSDVFSPFAFIIDDFLISKKIFAVICGNFQVVSICSDGTARSLVEYSKVQEIYDEMNPSAVELNLPKSAKYLILSEFKSFQTISIELIQNLAVKAKNASQLTNLIEAAISSFDQFHNFSLVVIDCADYK